MLDDGVVDRTRTALTAEALEYATKPIAKDTYVSRSNTDAASSFHLKSVRERSSRTASASSRSHSALSKAARLANCRWPSESKSQPPRSPHISSNKSRNLRAVAERPSVIGKSFEPLLSLLRTFFERGSFTGLIIAVSIKQSFRLKSQKSARFVTPNVYQDDVLASHASIAY